jgi:phospholipid transport system transporter-binding protein
MMSAAVELTTTGEGRCAVAGLLTLETAPQLWKQLGAGGLLRDAREADLSAVTDADSAGLALLVAWRAQCLAAGGALGFRGMPARVMALAKLTSAEIALGA